MIHATRPRRFGCRDLIVLSAATIVCFAVTLLMSPDARWIAAPIFSLLVLGSIFFRILYLRDGVLPVFEVGSAVVASTIVYGIYPLLNFAAAGLRWTEVLDHRLVPYDPLPREIGLYVFRLVAYLAAFCFAYLILRGRPGQPARTLKDGVPAVFVTALLVLIGMELVRLYVSAAYGSVGASYDEIRSGGVTLSNAPYFLQQIVFRLSLIRLIVFMVLITILIAAWRRRSVRVAFAGLWVLYGISVLQLRESRSIFFLLALASMWLYHRLVKPFRMKTLVILSVVFLNGFLLLGIARDYRDVGAILASGAGYLRTGNEFQSVFVNAYDLHERRVGGLLPPIPWQLYWSDLLLLVPSQLLPVAKIDPADWYLDVLGLRGLGVGLVFGVMAQAEIGFGLPELIVRGTVLGLLFAGIHRWYVKRSDALWITVFYLYLSVMSYSTYRNTTFSFANLLLNCFLPAMLLIRFIVWLVSTIRRPLDAEAEPAPVQPSAVPSCK